MEYSDYTERIRHFNRFYTRIIGVNNQYTDQTKYSSLDAQILYEISIKEDCTAVYLCDYFNMDKGYLSRILKKFEKEQLIEKTSSSEDRRINYIHITSLGLRELNSLITSANHIVMNMIERIPAEKLEELIHSMKKIESILQGYAKEI